MKKHLLTLASAWVIRQGLCILVEVCARLLVDFVHRPEKRLLVIDRSGNVNQLLGCRDVHQGIQQRIEINWGRGRIVNIAGGGAVAVLNHLGSRPRFRCGDDRLHLFIDALVPDVLRRLINLVRHEIF